VTVGRIKMTEIKAEELKEQANDRFKRKEYQAAIDLYTEAIELNGEVASYMATGASLI